MKKGHVGLWESITGIRPAVTAGDVAQACTITLEEFGITDQNLIREGWTTMKNRNNERLQHLIFRVPDTETFQFLTARFEDSAGNNGVTVHNRHVIRKPHEWVLSYYVGTHGQRTHKYDFVYNPEGTPTPAPIPTHMKPTADEPDRKDMDASDNELNDKPRIALIFDDFGADEDIARRFLDELDIPITLAVIPYQKHSADIIKLTRQSGQTPFLHMPMEPLNSDAMGNLSEYYLLTSMENEELITRTRKMLVDYDGVAGVNNHTGSRMTADSRAMETVLKEIRDRKLIFVDSRTTADTVAEMTARSLGIPTASRQVFIDQGYNAGDVTSSMLELADIARKKGSAIGIGHAIPSTLDDVKAILPKLLDSGVRVVPIRSLTN